MSIKKSADGLYHTNISFEGKRYAVTGKTEAEAHRNAGKLRAKLEAGQKLKRQGVTVKAFAEEWLETYRNSGSDSDKRYEQIVNSIIIPAIGTRKIKSITEQQLQDLINENSHYSFSQLSKLRMTLKQIFKKARKNKLILDDPAEDLTLPDCHKGTHRALTPEERRLLLTVAETHRDGLYVKIMLYCGLRPGEVDVLQWKHVDLAAGVIHVRQALKHDTNKIGPPKSPASVRDVPIPKNLLPDLQAVKSVPDAFVCGRDGTWMTRSSQNRMWKSILRAMDIKAGAVVYRNQIVQSMLADDLELYCLRHTYCTDLQSAGVPLNVAKELMGHEDISVTANIYTHTSSDTAKEAIGSLDTYLDEQKKKEKQRPESKTKIIRFPGA